MQANRAVMTADGFPRTVTVYGTGLIGTSFGLALKKRIPGIRVYGVDSQEILARAQSLGAIDGGKDRAPDFPDLVVLATPIGTILELLGELAPGPSVILDVGSTKVNICRKAAAHGLQFVGGHPMTGSERSGPEAASGDLFEKATF